MRPLDAGERPRREEVDPDAVALGEGALAEQPHLHGQPLARGPPRAGEQLFPPRQLVHAHSRQAERHPLAGAGAVAHLAVHLHPPHPDGGAARESQQLVPGAHLSPVRRAGHDGSRPGDREYPVDRDPERTVGILGPLDAARARQHGVTHGFDPAPAERGARDHRGSRQRPSVQVALDLLPAHLEQLPLHQVRLRERDDATPHPEHLEHAQVLARLRHHPLVGGHDQQGAVDPRGAGDHGVHEALVPGDVDERDLDLPHRGPRAARTRGRA